MLGITQSGDGHVELESPLVGLGRDLELFFEQAYKIAFVQVDFSAQIIEFEVFVQVLLHEADALADGGMQLGFGARAVTHELAKERPDVVPRSLLLNRVAFVVEDDLLHDAMELLASCNAATATEIMPASQELAILFVFWNDAKEVLHEPLLWGLHPYAVIHEWRDGKDVALGDAKNLLFDFERTAS